MKNILHIIQALSGGGAARELLNLATILNVENGYKHKIISLQNASAKGIELAAQRNIELIDSPDTNRIRLEIENADIVQVHWWNCYEIMHFLTQSWPECRMLMRYHVAGDVAPHQITENHLKMGDFNILSKEPNPVLKNFSKSWLDKRYKKVLHGTDFSRLSMPEKKIHDTFNIGYIGTVNFVKMHPEFITISDNINIPNAKFTVCGTVEEAVLPAQINATGNPQKFELTGYVEDISSYIAEMDVFGYPLCPDTYASTDLVLQEVMFAGIPAVVFPYGGLTQTVKHNENGLVVNNAKEYAEAIEFLYKNPDERKRLGDNAREFVLKNLGIENTSQNYRSIYKQLLTEPKRNHKWGKDYHLPILEQNIQLSDVTGVVEPLAAAEIWIESLMEADAEYFAKSLNTTDVTQALLAEKEIMNSTYLTAKSGVVPFRNSAPKDPYLNLWAGLVSEGLKAFREAQLYYTEAIQHGYTNWQVYWYLARTMDETGDNAKADGVRKNLQKIVPDLDKFLPILKIEEKPEALKEISEKEKVIDAQFNSPLNLTNNRSEQPKNNTNKVHDVKKNTYRVSAIVSTYNSAKFITAKLDDLLNQSLGEQLEIIVIDSNSPENEEELVAPYLTKHKNITFLRTNKRETLYQAWNRGIKMARGEYITNSNTDDRLKPDALETMANYLDDHNQITLVYGDYYVTGYENHTFMRHIRTGYGFKPNYNPNIMLHGCHMGPQPMWRRAVHAHIGYFEENLKAAGDYEMWCRMAANGYNMHYIPEFLGLYLHNGEGIINRDQSTAVMETLAVKELYKNRLPEPDLNQPVGFFQDAPVEENRYVNICMVTYNRLEYTKQSLQSVLSKTRFPHTITVVDNNSSDGTQDYLKDLKNKGVIKNLVLLEENVGVAKASNLAWSMEPDAHYYMKLDNDIIVQKVDWLKNAVDILDRIKNAGMIGYNFEPVSYPLITNNGITARVKPQGNLGGACLLIPKRTEEKLGYWCEDYGLYGEEDADYGARITLSNMLNVYMPDEDMGFHLPAGKAAAINANSLVAEDGMEEVNEKEYREWKDEQRRENINSGLVNRNFTGYKNGTKSLFIKSDFVNQYNSQKSLHNFVHEKVSQAGVPKIGFFTADGLLTACPVIRLSSPLSWLQKEALVELVELNINGDKELFLKNLHSLDILVIARNTPTEISYNELQTLLAGHKPKLVYETDDAFYNIDKHSSVYNYYQSNMPKIMEYIEKADLVTVTTQQLEKHLSKINSNCVVLPNILDETIWKFNTANNNKQGPIRILFAGTPTHEKDIQAISKALVRIAKEYKDKIELVLWGNTFKEFKTLNIKKEFIEFDTNYFNYAEKLQSLKIDLAIVPLQDTPFNRAKSHIKWLEYSACGIAGIYPRLAEYKEVITHKKNGLLVGKKSEEWYKAIKFMLNNPQKRLNIAQTAQQEVLANHTISKKANMWYKTYSQLLGIEEKSVIEDEMIYPDTSIIIPVFNNVAYTKKCINSIVKNTEPGSYEVIVVNNASSDGTQAYLNDLTTQNSWLKVINNSQNVGFAKANNQAAEQANGEYLLFLNNDTEVMENWLEPMISLAQEDDRIGVVGSKLLYEDKTIQHAGVVLIDNQPAGDPLQAQNLFVGQPQNFEEANQLREYQAVTAACMLMPKALYEQLAGFDENYWNGYEDVDLCLNVRKNGKKVVYQPLSEVIHYESKSGPERFSKAHENVALLHKKWREYTLVDFTIDTTGNVSENVTPQIKPYKSTLQEDTNLVSIIMLCANALEYTKKCVESIEQNTHFPYEIIFVDNASTDGTPAYLQELSRNNNKFKVITNKKNSGFSAGNNQGVKKARGKYIMLLNNDVLVGEHWLTDMVDTFNADPKIGMVSAVTNKASGLQVLANIPYKTDQEYFQFAREWRAEHQGKMSPRRRLAGFIMLTSKSIYNEIEGFDEIYGIGNFEDDDISLKIREKGYALMVNDGVAIHHYGHSSFKANKIDLIKSLEENEKIFRQKWPDVNYDELLEIENPLHKIHPQIIETAYKKIDELEYNSVIEMLEPVIQLDPVNGQALLALGMAYRGIEDWDTAFDYFQRANKHNPQNPIILNQMGMVTYIKQDVQAALNYFAAAIHADKSFIDAKRNYGLMLIESGDYENGVVAFTKILESNPDDVVSLLYMASLYVEVGQNERAHAFATRVLEIDAKNVEAQELLNSIQNGNGDTNHTITTENETLLDKAFQSLNNGAYEVAIEQFIHCIELAPTADALLGQAITYSQLEQWENAKQTLEQLIESWPQYTAAYNQLGLVWVALDKPEQAILMFKKAMEQEPNFLEAWRNLAHLQIEQGAYEQGIKEFTTLLEKHPDDVMSLLYMAGIYLEVGQKENSQLFIDKVLKIEPENEEAKQLLQQLNKAQSQTVNPLLEKAYNLLNDYKVEEAEACFNRSLQQENEPQAHFGLSLCYFQRDLELKGLQTLKNITEEWPEFAPAYNQLGMLSSANNKFEEAKDYFAKAIEKDALYVEAQRNYGLTLIELQDYENGITTFNKILENNPNDTETLLIMASFYCELERWETAKNFVDKVQGLEPQNSLANEFAELIKRNMEFV